MERLEVTLFYGAIMGLVLLLAWGSGSIVIQKLSAWLFVGWATTNVVFEISGPKLVSRIVWLRVLYAPREAF